MILIRIATKTDAEKILDIYAPYIRDTSLTFELEVPSLPMFEDRIEKYLHDLPWLVCEINGEIAGYAYASKYRERTGYQWSCECSVYIHNNYLKRGIAQSLYFSLTEILKRQGYRNIYAVINLPNEKSVLLHEKCGFEWMATYEKVGYKLGKWKDVGWWIKKINPYSENPTPPIPFNKLDNKRNVFIFNEASSNIKK